MDTPWGPVEPAFVNPDSAEDPVLQILHGWELEIAKAPLEGQSEPRTAMLGARWCYRNALHLYRSATFSAGSKDFGTARSLAILGLEEFGKAYFYAMLDLGLYSSNPRDRGKRPYLDRRVLKCHQCKQGLVFAMSIGLEVVMGLGLVPELAGAPIDESSPKASFSDLTERIRVAAKKVPCQEEINARLTASPAVASRLVELFADRAAMQRAKEDGLYVEFESNPPTCPLDIGPQQFESVRRLVAEKLVGFSKFFIMEAPIQELSVVRTLFSQFPATVFPGLECPRSYLEGASHHIEELEPSLPARPIDR